jgi:PKD domain
VFGIFCRKQKWAVLDSLRKPQTRSKPQALLKTKSNSIFQYLNKLTFKMTRTVKFLMPLLLIAFAISCGKDEPLIDPPKAAFDYVVNPDKSGKVVFTSVSTGAESYSWDFGDGRGTSTEQNPTYTYTESGTFEVSLTVKNAGGQDIGKTPVIVSVGPEEFVKDGDMSKETSWNTRRIWTNADNEVLHAFKNGAFVWDIPELGPTSGGWSNFVIWQEVRLEAGKDYVFSADIAATDGIDVGVWFEVSISNTNPAADGDFTPKTATGEDNRILEFDNNCGNDPFNGKLQVLAQDCSDDVVKIGPDGKFRLTAAQLTPSGTVYLAFKSGCNSDGNNYRAGLSMDNISIKEVL